MLAAAEIVVRGISLTIRSCGIQVVAARIFHARVAVNVIATPRILGHFLKQLIPPSGSGIALTAGSPVPANLALCSDKSRSYFRTIAVAS